MRKVTLCLLFMLCFSFSSLCYALDWRRLHNEADKMSVDTAKETVLSNPDLIDNFYSLALVYLNQHKDKEAGEIFDRILVVDPDVFEAEWGRAEVLRRMHRMKESQDILKRLIKEHPAFAPALITLAYIRYIEMNFEETVRLGKRVIKLGRDHVDDPNYALAYMIVGGAKGMLAHYGGPISKPVNGLAVGGYLKAGEKIQPNKAAVLFGLGNYFLLAPSIAGRDIDKAEKYFKKAIDAEPLFSDVYVRLAQVYQVRGDRAGYDRYIDQALLIDPGNEIALDIKSGACKFVCPSPGDK